ncbi:MAG: hemerythrin domain-containing protein [Comamonadaceae bacterium]|nr:MAG: hemerythrin domain-containing protein [Comamonadaceae bacterium]
MTPHSTSAMRAIRDQHASLSAVLRSLLLLVAQGPGDAPERFFDVLRAMLFYIDEFPERQHHPRESDLLFPKLLRAAPELMPVIAQLEAQHVEGEGKVRALQHLLLAWELIGESRRAAFIEAAQDYVRFYLDHMRVEEVQLLPVAQQVLSPEDWRELDAAFATVPDPLGGGARDPCYDRLFTRIVLTAPAPIGVGAALEPTP